MTDIWIQLLVGRKTPWNEWFYVENGKLVSGTTKKIGGTEYTFYTGGHMIASTLEYNSESGKYFLHDESGKKIDVSREGWYKVTYEGEAIWYYLKMESHMMECLEITSCLMEE